MTIIDNPQTNGRSDALVFVTQHYGKYNAHQIGVWYSGGKWLIYNEDKAAMPLATNFNVLALKPSSNAFLHTATTENILNNWTVIDHPKCNGKPNAVLLVTQNWKGTYNTKPIGVWYTNGKWAIYNQDRSTMPKASFNVLVLEEGKASGVGNSRASIFEVTSSSKQTKFGKHLASTNWKNNSDVLFITQNWQTAGKYNNHIPGVWFDQSSMTIFNQDKEELPTGAKFNVLAFTKKTPTVSTAPDIAVTLADYGTRGKELGRFIQDGNKSWKEMKGNKISYSFSEYARDEWSVYLKDASRNVFIQLDFHTKKVYYGEGSLNNKKVLYDVLNSSKKINGRMVKEVQYISANKMGKFVTAGKNKWTETNVNKEKLYFTETHRDDWSVYMEDRSRNIALQLDLHTLEVKYADIGKPVQAQYKITEAK